MKPAARPGLTDILTASRVARERYRPPVFTGIALDRPFVPVSFTQLYHTPLYDRLNERQRLRYNQLYGLRSNELFMLFEQGFTHRVIHHIRDVCARTEPLLADCLTQMLDEETRHHRMFLDFNRQVLPQAYRDGRGHFARPGPAERALLVLLTARPTNWPFMLWLILVLEEFSTAFSRLLGEREPIDGLATDYVRLHRLHLLDEARHVELDTLLIERLLPRLSAGRHSLNGTLFRRLLRTILAPRRSGIQVLRTLTAEQPVLARHLSAMESAVRALPRDPGLSQLIADAGALPRTHALLHRYPAFRFNDDD